MKNMKYIMAIALINILIRQHQWTVLKDMIFYLALMAEKTLMVDVISGKNLIINVKRKSLKGLFFFY